MQMVQTHVISRSDVARVWRSDLGSGFDSLEFYPISFYLAVCFVYVSPCCSFRFS